VTGWWYLAGVLFLVSAALWWRVGTTLSAANPSAYLPWVWWPPNKPRGIRVVQFLASFSMCLAVNFLFDGFHNRHPRDLLWSIPFVAALMVVGMVPPFRHNRRIRRAAI